jgi:hypothetical protein
MVGVFQHWCFRFISFTPMVNGEEEEKENPMPLSHVYRGQIIHRYQGVKILKYDQIILFISFPLISIMACRQ